MNAPRVGCLVLVGLLVVATQRLDAAGHGGGGGRGSACGGHGSGAGAWAGRGSTSYRAGNTFGRQSGRGGYGGFGRGYGGFGRGYGGWGAFGPGVFGVPYGLPGDLAFDGPPLPPLPPPPGIIGRPVPAPEPGTIVFKVPDNADVWVDGQRLDQVGREREFITSPIPVGGAEVYSVKIQWTENGKDQTHVQDVKVRSGTRASVTLLAAFRSSGK